MITCLRCYGVICHEAEFTPEGTDSLEDGLLCADCASEPGLCGVCGGPEGSRFVGSYGATGYATTPIPMHPTVHEFVSREGVAA